ncbi:MAG: hypothetical protein H6868_04785 [Rhodospirillales bacterium]|nr:hypothetical protein [Rhodospirillales bacterium]
MRIMIFMSVLVLALTPAVSMADSNDYSDFSKPWKPLSMQDDKDDRPYYEREDSKDDKVKLYAPKKTSEPANPWSKPKKQSLGDIQRKQLEKR